MAEAFARRYFPQDAVYSAGIEKHGLNPYMVKAMEECGFDMSTHYSKTIDELPPLPWDIVLTVCDNAQASCPALPARKIIHTPFDDPPALARNLNHPNEDTVLNIYRTTRDQINEYFKSLSL